MILDSLGADRGKKKVIMTIKEYLDHEWKAKYPKTPSHIMASMFDTTVKVPLQQNYYDCGIFVLQYVQQFLSKPFEIFKMPMDLSKWFEQSVIQTKRMELKNLIFQLSKQMQSNNGHSKSIEQQSIEMLAVTGQPEVKKSKSNHDIRENEAQSPKSSKKYKNLNEDEDEDIQKDENINFDDISDHKSKRKQTKTNDKANLISHKLLIKSASAATTNIKQIDSAGQSQDSSDSKVAVNRVNNVYRIDKDDLKKKNGLLKKAIKDGAIYVEFSTTDSSSNQIIKKIESDNRKYFLDKNSNEINSSAKKKTDCDLDGGYWSRIKTKVDTSAADDASFERRKRARTNAERLDLSIIQPSTSQRSSLAHNRHHNLSADDYSFNSDDINNDDRSNKLFELTSKKDRVLLFKSKSFLTVRNEDGGFFLCKACHSIYEDSKKCKIQWMDKLNDNEYKCGLVDWLDPSAIISKVAVNRVNIVYRIDKDDLKKVNGLLKKAIKDGGIYVEFSTTDSSSNQIIKKKESDNRKYFLDKNSNEINSSAKKKTEILQKLKKKTKEKKKFLKLASTDLKESINKCNGKSNHDQQQQKQQNPSEQEATSKIQPEINQQLVDCHTVYVAVTVMLVFLIYYIYLQE